jgi:hypothetical protein
VTWTLSAAAGDRALGEVISAALLAGPQALHQVGSRLDAGPVFGAGTFPLAGEKSSSIPALLARSRAAVNDRRQGCGWVAGWIR